jgi:hypothetical protein
MVQMTRLLIPNTQKEYVHTVYPVDVSVITAAADKFNPTLTSPRYHVFVRIGNTTTFLGEYKQRWLAHFIGFWYSSSFEKRFNEDERND